MPLSIPSELPDANRLPVVLVLLMVGHLLAILVGGPLHKLHGLLVIPENASVEERTLSYGRSTAIFALLGAAVYVAIYLLLERFKTP